MKRLTACLLAAAAATAAAQGLPLGERSAALRDWIADPDHVKPGSLMPAMQLDDAEIEQLVSFLVTLR